LEAGVTRIQFFLPIVLFFLLSESFVDLNEFKVEKIGLKKEVVSGGKASLVETKTEANAS